MLRSMPCNYNRNPWWVFSTEFCKILEQLLSRIIFLRGAASENKTNILYKESSNSSGVQIYECLENIL